MILSDGFKVADTIINTDMKNTFLVLAAMLVSLSLYAQEKQLLLTGTVTISIKNGTFDSDLTLHDIPPLKNYFIRLNSGMNLLYFKSKKPGDFLINYDKSLKDSTSTGESSAYYFADNTRKGTFLPESLQLKYVGKFPVVKDTIADYSAQDWKGNIAFNHNSVRADGAQSAWYPVLYDRDKDKAFEKVRYDIEVICADCSTLYVNGNLPVKGTSARFKSEVPQELAIFCGNYDYSNTGGTYILNPDLDKKQVEEFSALINTFKKYYEAQLRIPFEQATVFISTTPTSRKNGWLFVSYPSIFSIGWGNNGLKSLFNPKIQNWYRPFIGHELGHYYFGNYKVFNAELGDMMSEGFAEYLALQLTKNVIGKEVYTKKIQEKIDDLQEFKPHVVPFGHIKSATEYADRELYVYYYAPVIFSAIEKEIGEKLMWQWLAKILKTETTYTNYAFLCSTLQETLQNEPLFEKIKKTYFESEASVDNAAARLLHN